MIASGPVLSDCAVEFLESVDSTNAEAMRQAMMGGRGPKWIVGRQQTCGRGRAGRVWQSDAGNLHASLLFQPACQVEHLPQLSLVAGIGVYNAISGIAGEGTLDGHLRLKWPNDVLVGNAKAGGVLVESTQIGGDLIAIIGVGVNVAAAPRVEGRDITSVAGEGVDCSVEQLLEVLVAQVGRWLGIWQNGAGLADVIAAWYGRTGAVGEVLTVNSGDELVSGQFAGLDETGALILKTSGGVMRCFAFGDVSLATPGRADWKDG